MTQPERAPSPVPQLTKPNATGSARAPTPRHVRGDGAATFVLGLGRPDHDRRGSPNRLTAAMHRRHRLSCRSRPLAAMAIFSSKTAQVGVERVLTLAESRATHCPGRENFFLWWMRMKR